MSTPTTAPARDAVRIDVALGLTAAGHGDWDNATWRLSRAADNAHHLGMTDLADTLRACVDQRRMP